MCVASSGSWWRVDSDAPDDVGTSSVRTKRKRKKGLTTDLKGSTPAAGIAEARQIVQRRFEAYRRFFLEALAQASERRHKPTLLRRIVRRLKGGAV